MSFTSQAVAFGCSVAPMMVVAGREEALWSYGLFGLIIIVCGLFSLCLPETKGKNISDTLEEQEFAEKQFF